MKNKFWIGFGIFGIICLIVSLIITGLVFTSLGGTKRTYTPPTGINAPTLNSESPLRVGEFLETGKEITPSQEIPSRLVIKAGTINIVVKDIADSVKKIIKYAQDEGGWVVSSSITEREKVPSGNITIRVPAEKFGEAMTYFHSLAIKVTYEGSQGQDVTEEYIDLQSRLRNLEATESQLLEIMKRAGKVSEILDVYRELTNVRQQIEQTKGKMQYLDQSAKMSSITVNLALSEEMLPIPPAEKWRPTYVLKMAWHSVLASLRKISYLVIWLGVYGIIWIPLGIIIWKIREILRKKRVNQNGN
jgi:hypothetical protein